MIILLLEMVKRPVMEQQSAITAAENMLVKLVKSW